MKQWSEIEHKIKVLAETESVPESLLPEAMKQKLEESKTVKKRSKKIKYIRFGSVAAALLLVFVLSATVVRENFISSGKNDVYENIIEIGKGDTDGQLGDNHFSSEADEVLKSETSYNDIYNKIKEVQELKRGNDTNYGSEEEIVFESSKNEVHSFTSSIEDTVALGTSTANKDYSTTNIQEQGVNEADSVITDGAYFYIQKDGESVVTIVKVDGAQMETVSEISVGKFSQKAEQYLHEFYVVGNKLFLMTSYYEFEDNTSKDETIVITYDISDRANPKEISRLSQSGGYHSSRMADGYLYVFSDYCVDHSINKDEPGTFVPLISGEAIGCEDIFIPEKVDSCQYKVITSIDTEKPECFTENRSVLCGSGIIYVSTNNIYFTAYESIYNTDENYDYTEIWKFTYDKGRIVGTASGKVKGNITDQFALHESNGYLRVVTTYEQRENYEETTIVEGDNISKLDVLVSSPEGQKNGLYVLNGDLQSVGSLEDLAPGESIYSARFFENTAYFVTFRLTDPLFSVDLSDPTKPKLLGELKIPGFSEYLHPYGEGLLLGIGYEANEEGVRTGVKLTMFDVSDPANVKEVTTHMVTDFSEEGIWANCSDMYDHKKILLDVEKNLIGFSFQRTKEMDSYYRWQEDNEYVVYGYDQEKGFFEKMNTTYSSINKNNLTDEQKTMNEKKQGSLRGQYIDSYFYTINRNFEICCYDMEQDFVRLSQYEY